MIKIVLALFVLSLSGCATLSPLDYDWYIQYADGRKKTAYVKWFNDKNDCVGSTLYVPQADDVMEMPTKIVRVDREDKSEKKFHMCEENKHPDYAPHNYFQNIPR